MIDHNVYLVYIFRAVSSVRLFDSMICENSDEITCIPDAGARSFEQDTHRECENLFTLLPLTHASIRLIVGRSGRRWLLVH